MTESQIPERDRSVSSADQGEKAKHHDQRNHHELSCRASDCGINRGDLILTKDTIKTVPYVPLSHRFAERLIGTIRRECFSTGRCSGRSLIWS